MSEPSIDLNEMLLSEALPPSAGCAGKVMTQRLSVLFSTVLAFLSLGELSIWMLHGSGGSSLYFLVDEPRIDTLSVSCEQNDICRICLQHDVEDATSESNILVSPCNCTGTQRFVHLNCLRIWQEATLDERRRICGVCKEYFAYPPPPSHEELVYQAVTQHMMPRRLSVIVALKANTPVDIETTAGLHLSWDVHRIADAERYRHGPCPWAYLFRVKIKNISPSPCTLQGVARFYVLRAPDGLVFPIHRVTEGRDSPILNSEDEYKYSWIFYTRYQTLEAAGGLLMENVTEEDDEEKRFLSSTLEPVDPAGKSIVFEDVRDMIDSYRFMGALDLRDAQYI
eukprot:gnl/TRDRNA2_/TRDRNA2_126942_c0_seq1.p1 gnl/TRDRNA2_/TRDRNA2_126942_c0~~gnl/TRDRNA2_/TRDRNA2_126942_c0_seq1.p1  ORF type:complete len:339 (+),score=29.39 gnl/TRDRNA2_/TRDRNA2_126942_c0_seq1:45-1061(+)